MLGTYLKLVQEVTKEYFYLFTFVSSTFTIQHTEWWSIRLSLPDEQTSDLILGTLHHYFYLYLSTGSVIYLTTAAR
jgi:hypothetical protein